MTPEHKEERLLVRIQKRESSWVAEESLDHAQHILG
jgi:hypothetical protein